MIEVLLQVYNVLLQHRMDCYFNSPFYHTFVPHLIGLHQVCSVPLPQREVLLQLPEPSWWTMMSLQLVILLVELIMHFMTMEKVSLNSLYTNTPSHCISCNPLHTTTSLNRSTFFSDCCIWFLRLLCVFWYRGGCQHRSHRIRFHREKDSDHRFGRTSRFFFHSSLLTRTHSIIL